MAIALGLARRGHGNVWPNPSVGCVIARDGVIVGRGWTQPGGRPHAETEALARAGDRARGATAYVTLEPCAHHGETPPCSDALIAAGIARVVVGIADPDPRVDGGGIARLEAAGIAVERDVSAAACAAVAAGFLMRIRDGRPLVTAKTATTLDGRIATRSGESRWITGAEARALGHGLRARHDGILVGGRTVAADDPSLTCRLPGLEGRSPVRIVVSGRDPVPLSATVVTTARETPTWLLARPDAEPAYLRALGDAGVEIVEVDPDGDGGLDLAAALRALAARGLTRVLVEGGGRLIGALLARDLVDELVSFRADCIVGGDGIPAIGAFGVAALDAAPRFRRLSARPAGADLVETFSRIR